jgi:AcrR family transcriptional regulator
MHRTPRFAAERYNPLASADGHQQEIQHMARARAKDYDDKQREITARAAELFTRQGYHNTSMAELAKACGSSKARLYHYYPSKEALLYQMLSDFIKQVYSASQQALESSAVPQDALRARARALMELSTKHHDLYPLLFNELDALPPRQRDQIRAHERKLVTQVTALLAKVRPDLVTKPHHSTPLAMIFLGAVNWTYHWFAGGGRLTAEEFADLVTDIMLGNKTVPQVAVARGAVAVRTPKGRRRP